jgi:hypothetical protein
VLAAASSWCHLSAHPLRSRAVVKVAMLRESSASMNAPQSVGWPHLCAMRPGTVRLGQRFDQRGCLSLRYLNHLHRGSADALLQHNDFAFSLTCMFLICAPVLKCNAMHTLARSCLLATQGTLWLPAAHRLLRRRPAPRTLCSSEESSCKQRVAERTM